MAFGLVFRKNSLFQQALKSCTFIHLELRKLRKRSAEEGGRAAAAR